ncbi:MAG: DEAD/DEAH box helicase family protein, partial [Dehalococcoidia bacterium]|nr:DEAD/DEAH box helicase family protein [Dehalococcoidia bacterium]
MVSKISFFNLAIEPRPYQSEATEWALTKGQAICSLPTGTGKTLVAVLWLKTLFETGKIKNALILEPTRLLVNQTSDYFFYKAGVKCVPIDGRIPHTRRAELWQSEVIVATPETAFNDIELVHSDAVVVDECHHTVGQDAFARVMLQLQPSYKLGLSAFIPARREREITELIGPIRRWNWNDPEIKPYVPNWIGEVYEANLSSEELGLLKVIRQLPGGDGLNPALLERYLTRDGSPAVRETLTKKNRRLAQAFGEMLLPVVPDKMHKLEAVNEVIDSHEPHKAIIFVDRVIIADKVGTLFPQMQPVVFKGKRGKFDQGTALHQARDEETQLVVSTSAGEEGIDLPLADLLVIWGNAASDIRFIQRLGRMMRKTGEGLKFATFVVTPESSDFDSFAFGLAKAAEAGTIDVEDTFGWDPEILWPRTTLWHISELLRNNPRPLTEMAEALEVRDELAEKIVANAVRRGRLFYIYDVEAIVRDAEAE